MQQVNINRRAQKRLQSLFPWVYTSDILSEDSYQAGELVEVCSEKGKKLGIGYLNFKSKIGIRILSFGKLESDWLEKRLQIACDKRSEIFTPEGGCRLVHSEADGLPGLIIDYYNQNLIFQFNTAGIEQFREEVLLFFQKKYPGYSLWEKSDIFSRKLEGLPATNGFIKGQKIEEIVIEENGLRFWVSLARGQKTGFYLDQRENRVKCSHYIKQGDRVLDVFSHTGGFALYAAYVGAQVDAVEISTAAVELAQKNAELNNLEINFYTANAFDWLKEKSKIKREVYDFIILDPPPFSKTKKDLQGARRGMKELLLRGIQLLKSGGKMAVFSCSHHFNFSELEKVILSMAEDLKVNLFIKEMLSQASDHPIVLNFPFSWYLKGYLLEKG